MRKMKKLVSILLAATMVFTMTACGKKEEKPAPADTAQTAEQPKDDAAADSSTDAKTDEPAAPAGDAKAAVFYYTFADPYISSVRAALDKALGDASIAYQNYDAAGQQNTQTDQVNTALSDGANILIVNLVDTASADAANAIIEAAKAKDATVIFFNREIPDEVIQGYDKSVFVGTKAEEAGILQGQMIGQYLVDNFDKVDLNKDGKLSYVMFKGQQGNPEAEMRTKYAVEDADKILKDNGKPALEFYDAKNTDKYLVDKNGTWSAQASNEYMTTIFSEYSDANKNMVEVVIANNDGMAEGAITALNTVGYNTGDADKMIPVFGVDATDTAKDLIKKGQMTGTIKQDAEGMANAIAFLTANVTSGKALMDSTDSYNIDANVNKIRIPYGIYTGE